MFSFRTVTFPNNREIRSSLQTMSGMGFWKSFFICAKIGVGYPFFIYNLNFYYFLIFTFFFKRLVLSANTVKRKLTRAYKTLLSFRSWRALRHKDHLPVNGQRTRSNAGTRRKEKVIILRAKEEKEREKEREKEKAKEGKA